VSQDADGNPLRTLRMRKLASPASRSSRCLRWTFCRGSDWLLGSDYKWGSTMWGVYIFRRFGRVDQSMARADAAHDRGCGTRATSTGGDG